MVNPPSSMLSQIHEDERGLLRAIQRSLPDDDSELVLVLDQFEEVFTSVRPLASPVRDLHTPRSRGRIATQIICHSLFLPLQST